MKKWMTFFLLAMIVACHNPKKESLPVVDENVENQPFRTEEDTTIYASASDVETTAILENAQAYFRMNNKYKDWDQKDKKTVIVQCVVEKDSTASNIQVRGCGNKELDNEAIRLIKEAKITPAEKGNRMLVRSLWTILVHFPAE